MNNLESPDPALGQPAPPPPPPPRMNAPRTLVIDVYDQEFVWPAPRSIAAGEEIIVRAHEDARLMDAKVRLIEAKTKLMLARARSILTGRSTDHTDPRPTSDTEK